MGVGSRKADLQRRHFEWAARIIRGLPLTLTPFVVTAAIKRIAGGNDGAGVTFPGYWQRRLTNIPGGYGDRSRYDLACEVASIIGPANDAFDRARFLAACDPNVDVKWRSR